MRYRFPLLLKKRGLRRTGSPWWARSGELLYHSVFIIVGATACVWQVVNVLVPDWQRGEQAALYQAAECKIISGRIAVQPSLAGPEFAPVCAVSLTSEGLTDELEESQQTTDAFAGHFSPDRQQAERTLERFPPGEMVQCWVDPEDTSRVILYRGARWWPLMLLLIPASLFVIGTIGLLRTLLRSSASVERRQSVAQQAGRYDPFSSAQVSVALAAALPQLGDVEDSPGIKLRYRLPIEGSRTWRLAGMALMSLAWNVVVGFFLVGVVMDHWAGRPNWPLTLVVGPLAIAGGWLAYTLLRDTWTATGVGVAQIELSDHPIHPGQTCGGLLLQAGQFQARSLTVSLVCDEIATFNEGTDTRTSTEEVFRQILHRERRFRIDPERPYEKDFTFKLPEDAMHSLVAPHNEVRWSLEVHGAPVRWPEFRRRFRLCVYPRGVTKQQLEATESRPMTEADRSEVMA